MVSLPYLGLQDKFAEPTTNCLRDARIHYQTAGHNQQYYRDCCGDCPNNSITAKIFPKNSRGRKEKRFQPFKSTVSPWTKCATAVPFSSTQIPRDYLSFSSSTNKKQAILPRVSKSTDGSRFIVKAREMREFFKLTDDAVIQDFLKADSCKRIADKYLIAMVFAYFKRADFSIKEYSRMNFFIGLYLANDVEEDEEEIKYEIFPWILGRNWKNKYPSFLKMRDAFFRRIDYKAIISRRCCDEIMAIESGSTLWKRERPIHHGGAIRNYMKDPEDDGFPRGPQASPRYCTECDAPDSQYDSASPDSTSWYISSQDSSPDNDDLHKTLPQKSDDDNNDDIWPTVEE